MKKIGFFGHSSCSNSCEGSYLDTVAKHFDAQIVNKGIGQGSEERILFELKKHDKNLDIAVILHSRPQALFLPSCKKDIDLTKRHQFKKYKFWENKNPESIALLEEFYSEFGDLKQVFKNPKTFLSCLEYYKTYLYHPDLHLNRFQGALVLIDSYCASRVPATVHIIDRAYVPPWLTEFQSGARSEELEELFVTHRARSDGKLVNPCGINLEGHEKISKILIDLISAQLDKK